MPKGDIMNIKKWLKNNTASLSGKTVAISGSTGGIGRELCRYLAMLGADLVLIDRDQNKSMALEEKLKADFPSLKVIRVKADMSEPQTVTHACDTLRSLPIDILILNAGAYSIPRKICDSGYDNVFQINFVSPYRMVIELLPLLRERGGRVVVVGSIAHNYSHSDPADVDFSTRTKASLVYGNSKRYLMFTLSQLFENEKNVSLAITHPGITFTNITAHYPKLIFAVIKHPMKVIFPPPRKACLSILKGVFEETNGCEWIGPSCFNVWGSPKKQRLTTVKGDELEYFAGFNVKSDWTVRKET